jgi:hypothetical protein
MSNLSVSDMVTPHLEAGDGTYLTPQFFQQLESIVNTMTSTGQITPTSSLTECLHAIAFNPQISNVVNDIFSNHDHESISKSHLNGRNL